MCVCVCVYIVLLAFVRLLRVDFFFRVCVSVPTYSMRCHYFDTQTVKYQITSNAKAITGNHNLRFMCHADQFFVSFTNWVKRNHEIGTTSNEIRCIVNVSSYRNRSCCVFLIDTTMEKMETNCTIQLRTITEFERDYKNNCIETKISCSCTLKCRNNAKMPLNNVNVPKIHFLEIIQLVIFSFFIKIKQKMV